MKKILCIGILWCCTIFARAQTATIQYKVTGYSSPLCCQIDTWCKRDIDCTGRFPCKFSPSALDLFFYFDAPNPGGTFGSNPFRYKVDLLHNGITISFQQSPNLSSSFYGFTFNVTPLLIGSYEAKVVFQKRTIGGWVNVGTYFTNTINVVSFCPPIVINPTPLCISNVTISGPNFATPLTESQTWIASSGTTIVPGNASVKLDANPTSGFVQLNPGFETQSGANLVAQALDGCGSAAPMRQAPGNVTVGEALAPEKETENASSTSAATIYPNPTGGSVTVRHSGTVKILQVYNVTGTLLKTINANKRTVTAIDLGTQPAGIYILRADGRMMGRIIKQ
jgi:Secretion system C-terminal sorting domain